MRLQPKKRILFAESWLKPPKKVPSNKFTVKPACFIVNPHKKGNYLLCAEQVA